MSEQPANDDAPPPVSAIALADLARAAGMDEDDMLQRLAAILVKREDGNQ